MLQGQGKLRSSEPFARLDGEREAPKRPTHGTGSRQTALARFGGWRFAPRKGMLGEGHVGGPATTAEIEAVAETLRCVVGDLIGPYSAHGDLPFRSSGLL